MLKVATKILEITGDNLKENIFGYVVVIYDVNLSLWFVRINFNFFLLSVFILAHALMSLYNFCFDLFFGKVIFSHALQDHF